MGAEVGEVASQKDLDGLGGRVSDLDKQVAVAESKIETIEKNGDHIWGAIKESVKDMSALKESMNKMKIDITKNNVIIGIVQLILTAGLIKFLIK